VAARFSYVGKRALPFDPIAVARTNWDERGGGGATMQFATSIMRAQQIVLAATDAALKPFGLNFARFEALVLLSFTRRGSLPLGKMGERLMIHPASVTNIVDRLEAQGFVTRLPHPDDGRTTLCELTPSGRDVVSAALIAVNETGFGVDHLSDDDLATGTALLTRLRSANGDFE
jgi:DNA-binding MarR family transcriptional regulator